MKLEVGKKYKTRSRGMVDIVHCSEDSTDFKWPYYGIAVDSGLHITYTENGHRLDPMNESPFDLIEEVTPTPTNPS